MYDIICRFISFLGKISWGASFPVHPVPPFLPFTPAPSRPFELFPPFSALHHRSPKFRFGARPPVSGPPSPVYPRGLPSRPAKTAP